MASEPFLPPDGTPDPGPGANSDSNVPTAGLPVVTGAGTTPPGTSTGAPSLLTDTGLTPNVAAGLAVLATLISGLIFLLLEKKNQFVRFWAMQAVFFGAAIFVCSVVSSVIGSILGHVFWLFGALWGLFSLLIYLGLLVIWVVMLLKAFNGKEWEIPFIGKLARQQLSVLPK